MNPTVVMIVLVVLQAQFSRATSSHSVPHLMPSIESRVMDPARPVNSRAQFMSAVQLVIYETDPGLFERSQKITMRHLKDTFAAQAGLNGRPYEVHTRGNEVVLYLTSPEDLHLPVQQAVATMIGQLNGRVRAKGRSLYYRTSLAEPGGGLLEVVVNEDHDKVVFIAAQAVPLRDVLKEIKSQIGGISYLVPGDCADQRIDWSFGEASNAIPKPLDAVIGELATLFGLKLERKNGTFIFTGNCSQSQARLRPKRQTPMEFVTVLPSVHEVTGTATQVVFPLPPMD